MIASGKQQRDSVIHRQRPCFKLATPSHPALIMVFNKHLLNCNQQDLMGHSWGRPLPCILSFRLLSGGGDGAFGRWYPDNSIWVVLQMWKLSTTWNYVIYWPWAHSLQAYWSLRTDNVNPCDIPLLPHHQPIRELCIRRLQTLQPASLTCPLKILSCYKLSEVRQKKRNTFWYRLYGESKKKKKTAIQMNLFTKQNRLIEN